MGGVTLLRPVESVGLDPVRLSALYREFGSTGAEGLVSRAVSEMAVLVTALLGFYKASEFKEFSRGLRSFRRVAEHAGFTSLARAAEAVAHCADGRDATALAATWARLLRLARTAMTSGGDLRGLSR